MNKVFDLVALGEAMVEFNQTDPGLPEYLQGFGGDTSNSAIAAARAGATVAYLTRLGDDTFGESLRTLWHQEKINAEGVTTETGAQTGIYFVTHNEKGHTFTYRRAGSAASRMDRNWLNGIPAKQIKLAKWLHVSGISLAISEIACETSFEAMRIARASQTLVSFDSNLRLGLWPLERARQQITQAITLCDLFLPSLEDMTTLTGLTDPEAIIAWSHKAGAKIVVLKLGSGGAIISNPQSGIEQRVTGLKVEALDATGAGDCFCGNLLAHLAMGDSLLEATRYANAAAAITVQGFGAVACLPSATDVYSFLQK